MIWLLLLSFYTLWVQTLSREGQCWPAWIPPRRCGSTSVSGSASVFACSTREPPSSGEPWVSDDGYHFFCLFIWDHDCNCLLFYIRNRTPGQNKNVFWKNIVKLLTFLNSVNSIFFIWSHDRIFAKKHFDIVHLYLNQRDIKQIRTSSSMHISRFEINIRVSKYWEERREVSRESRAEVGCHISQPGPYNVGIPRMASKICQRQRQPRTMGADMLTCHAPIAYTRCVGVYLQGEIKHVSASHLLIL